MNASKHNYLPALPDISQSFESDIRMIYTEKFERENCYSLIDFSFL